MRRPVLSMIAIATFALAVSFNAAIAGPADKGKNRIPILPDEWRELTAGKTLHYSVNGIPHGREFYPFGTSDRVYFQFADGTCLEGTWAYVDPVYRFQYFFDGGYLEPDDFQHYREGENIYAEFSNGNRHLVARITDQPLACTPEVTS